MYIEFVVLSKEILSNVDFTVTFIVVSCPSYFTVKICSPSSVLSYPVTSTLSFVKSIGSDVSPFSYVAVIFPPARFRSSPFSYVVFVGLVVISIFVISFLTVTLNSASFSEVEYFTVSVCSPNWFLSYPVTFMFSFGAFTIVSVPAW